MKTIIGNRNGYLLWRTKLLRCLSGNYPAILSISRTGQVAWMQLGSQRRLFFTWVKSLSSGASQSAVRCRSVSLRIVWPSHSHISSLSTAIVALKKPKVAGSQIWAAGGLIDLGDTSFAKTACRRADVEGRGLGRRIVMMKLPSPLTHSYDHLLLTASLSRQRTLM